MAAETERGAVWDPSRLAHLPAGIWWPALALLLAAGWAAVHAAGGAETAWTHLFHVVILLAALRFGARGGVAVATVAAVLCGPLMPLDTATGSAQDAATWVTRGGLFVGVGLVTGWILTSLRGAVQDQLTDRLQHELEVRTITVPPLTDTEVAGRIRRAVTERRFHPVYQPIYDLRDGRLVAVEALTRFDGEPSQPPNVWFDQAELAGMSVALDLAAMTAALEGARALPPDVALHLNVTPPTLRERRFLQLLAAHPHLRIVVEVTEHEAIHDYRRLEPVRRQLRARGIRLAVDDAGAGFSSLRHIVRLAPEIIKLDISLTRDIRRDTVQYALAQALVAFAADAGCQLVAEGIDTPADLAAWRKLGADAAQGNLLAPPGALPAPSSCSHVPRRPRIRIPHPS